MIPHDSFPMILEVKLTIHGDSAKKGQKSHSTIQDSWIGLCPTSQSQLSLVALARSIVSERIRNDERDEHPDEEEDRHDDRGVAGLRDNGRVVVIVVVWVQSRGKQF